MEYIDTFQKTVDRFPDRTAIKTLAGDTYRYAGLDLQTDQLAAALDDRLGNARCAGLLLNGPAALATILTGQKRGRANVQLSYRATGKVLAQLVEHADVGGLIFDEANAETAEIIAEHADLDLVVPVGKVTINVPEKTEAIPYEELLDDADDQYVIDNNSPAESVILFTSGTTGIPKGTLQNQKQSWLASTQAVMEQGFAAEDIGLMLAPWYHDVTLVTCIFNHWQVGGTLVPQPTFDPKVALHAIETHGVTNFLAVPTQLEAMLDELQRGDYDLSSLEMIRTGGAMVPADLIDRVQKHMTERVYNTYGLTEGFANLTFAYPFEQRENPGTIGNTSFVWDEVRVVEAGDQSAKPDPEATITPPGIGEIIGKGPHTDGYLNAPEVDEELFVDGWLRTGDVARIDENGGLYIVDRIDNMIVSGGENVYPQEVEAVLKAHPGVDDVAVVGADDAKWGQMVSAVVVGKVEEHELDQWCKDDERLPDFKRPRQYAFVNDIPRSDTGTVQRNRIREEQFP